MGPKEGGFGWALTGDADANRTVHATAIATTVRAARVGPSVEHLVSIMVTSL